MSDPRLNYQFGRSGEPEPPWPDEGSRKRSPLATGSADFGKQLEDGNDNTDGRGRPRSEAEALFRRTIMRQLAQELRP